MKDQFCLTPYFLDQPLPGLKPLLKPSWQINEPHLPNDTVMTRMLDLYQPLAQFVCDSVINGERPVSIAGDCCTSIGVLSGLQRAAINPILIWFDAHGDFNTWETRPSGFLGGMPLAMLVGRGQQTILEGLDMDTMPESRVILTDARDLDSGEQAALAESQVIHLPEVEKLLDIHLPEGPLYVHFDTDVIDPSEAPAMNYPTPNGPSVAKIQRVFSYIAQTNRIVAVSLSSWNPNLDTNRTSQDVCMSLLGNLLKG
jgi:arginase